jgi:hypothetical protein
LDRKILPMEKLYYNYHNNSFLADRRSRMCDCLQLDCIVFRRCVTTSAWHITKMLLNHLISLVPINKIVHNNGQCAHKKKGFMIRAFDRSWPYKSWARCARTPNWRIPRRPRVIGRHLWNSALIGGYDIIVTCAVTVLNHLNFKADSDLLITNCGLIKVLNWCYLFY